MQVLLLILLAYLIYKVVTRIVMPFREVKKSFEEQMRNAQQTGRRSTDNRREGDIRVEEPKKTGPTAPSIDGEYVEYEEVD